MHKSIFIKGKRKMLIVISERAIKIARKYFLKVVLGR